MSQRFKLHISSIPFYFIQIYQNAFRLAKSYHQVKSLFHDSLFLNMRKAAIKKANPKICFFVKTLSGSIAFWLNYSSLKSKTYSSSNSSEENSLFASKDASKIKIALPSVSIMPCSSKVFRTRPTISREQPTIRPIS